MSAPRYPSLFQVNTRVRLSELSAALGRHATLDDIAAPEHRLGNRGLNVALCYRFPSSKDGPARTSQDVVAADQPGGAHIVRR